VIENNSRIVQAFQPSFNQIGYSNQLDGKTFLFICFSRVLFAVVGAMDYAPTAWKPAHASQ
jgi:hypothetical protein